jgi:hypothetical protein
MSPQLDKNQLVQATMGRPFWNPQASAESEDVTFG